MKTPIATLFDRYPRRWTYPVLGLALALGAPVGYFIFRAILGGLVPSPWFTEMELRERLDAYVYLAVATSIVFVKLGSLLGADQDRLRADSLSDPLTSLPNRRYVQQRARELLQPRRSGEPVSLLLIDLDGLKQINATSGHEGGDRALCAVATTLRRVCRREDAFARYGGDEFVVLSPRLTADQAVLVAHRICSTLVSVAASNGLGSLSVSIGVTDTERASSNTLMALLQKADLALQVAKLEGKNRAHLSDPADADRLLVRSLHTSVRKGALS